jgi:hypothetical protein
MVISWLRAILDYYFKTILSPYFYNEFLYCNSQEIKNTITRIFLNGRDLKFTVLKT